MKLNQIFKDVNPVDITHLSSDSRDVVAGSCYFALKGFVVNGHDYIDSAISKGAVAIVHTEPVNKQEGIEYIQVEDIIATLHLASNIFFDYPSHKLRVHGVTGTNGKTTITKSLYNTLNEMGYKAAYIGTLSIDYGEHSFTSNHTTPDILELHSLLNDMVLDGVSDVCLEVSSQGLDLRRVEGVKFADASFSNLTQDHLDYHHTMEAYFEAKALFFNQSDDEVISIINEDDPYGKRLLDQKKPNFVSYGIHDGADYQATDLDLGVDATRFTLIHKGQQYPVKTYLKGLYNLYNVLNLIAILNENGFDLEAGIKALERIEGVEGRLDPIDLGQDFKVYVDYAHSPDSVKVVLQYLMSIRKEGARVIGVMGGDGSRDVTKRAEMAFYSSEYSDLMILTNSDYRLDDPKEIMDHLLEGIKKDNYVIIWDRVEAIEHAIRIAKKDDIIIILGRGRDTGIEIGGVTQEYIGDHAYAEIFIKEVLNENK